MEIVQQSNTRHYFAPVIMFALTLFLSASLMFVLQPMFGKLLLPLLGGAASVWNTCMVFYQGVLFIGYYYAHLLSRHFRLKRQIQIHGIFLLVSLFFLPVSLPSDNLPPANGNPSFWLLMTLGLSIGLPFFVLSTTSPLLQKWFSRIGHNTSKDPYYLSIASNTGSLIALLSYPFLLEPNIGLSDQQEFWSVGFLLLCACIFFCMTVIKQNTQKEYPGKPSLSGLEEQPNTLLKFKWLILSFVPSSMLLGTTSYISIDIASVPLLWVFPLALYLISFIIVFSRYSKKVQAGFSLIQPWVVAPFLVYYFSDQKLASFSLELLLHVLVFFISVMVCHGELAKKRPTTEYLTNYYLIMSLGGVLGGVFNSFMAPLLFNDIHEYPMMIIAALLLNPHNHTRRLYFQQNWMKFVLGAYWLFFAVVFYRFFDQSSEELMLGLILAAALANFFIFRKNPVYLGLYSLIIVSCATPDNRPNDRVLYQRRNFYGILTLQQKSGIQIGASRERLHEMYSGSTEHGSQVMTGNRNQCIPLGYYSQPGPLGQLFNDYDRMNERWHIGIVGLGAGTVAAYGKSSQRWRFFELNPTVVEVATNPEYFTYLNGCLDDYALQTGDARLALEQEQAPLYDLLVIDAFTSDSIPTHLLTREAVELYFSRLKQDGILVYHVSNHHLSIKKVLSGHADRLGLTAYIQEYRPDPKPLLTHKSDWAVLVKNEQVLDPLLQGESVRWQKLESYEGIQPWTDDFTSIVAIWK